MKKYHGVIKCKHLKHTLIITAGWYRRPKNADIPSDEALIYQCDKCNAIRIDNKNVMCYGKGTWSHYTIRPL